MENRNKRGQFTKRYNEWRKEKSEVKVKPLQDKNSLSKAKTKGLVNQKVPPVEAGCKSVRSDLESGRKTNTTTNTLKMASKQVENSQADCVKQTNKSTKKNEDSSIKPVHIESTETKPQEQLTMRERLAQWKQEKKMKQEMELKSKTKVLRKVTIHSAPPSTQKQNLSERLSGKTDGLHQTANIKLERRATFSVRTGSNHLLGTTKTKPRFTQPKPIENKKPRVSIKKPVLVISPTKKPSQKPACARGRNVSHANIRRQSTITRRRLSAGMSKRPVGILKRRSCFPSITCSSGTPEIGTATEGLAAVEHTRVKFLTPSQTPVQHHTTFRKTPCKSMDSQCSHESMRDKLNRWLETKGKTPSKFRHLMCFDAAMSERKKKDSQMTRSITVEQLSKQQEKMASEDKVCQNLMSQFEAAKNMDKGEKKEYPMGIAEQLDALLEECHHLIETGCPTDTLLPWLTNIYDNMPLARYYTPFYRCKVEAVRKHGSHTDVIDVMSQAIINSAQPSSELAALNASVMKEILGQASVPAVIIDTAEQNMEMENATGVKESPLASCLELNLEDLDTGNSMEDIQEQQEEEPVDIKDKATEAPFSVQYCVTNVTPFKKRKRAASLCTPCHTQTVVTPVRRSTRRSVHGNITDAEKIVQSISELTDLEKNSALFRPNHALDDVLESFQ